MEDALYAALVALATYEGAIVQDIPRMFNNALFRQQVLANVQDTVALEFWLDEFQALSIQHQREIARPILHRIRKFYRDLTLRRILCQPDSLDFRQISRERKIFLANLQGLPSVEGETIGALLIAKLQMAAMSQGELAATEREDCYLYIDEVQKFITTSLRGITKSCGLDI